MTLQQPPASSSYKHYSTFKIIYLKYYPAKWSTETNKRIMTYELYHYERSKNRIVKRYVQWYYFDILTI